MSDGARLLNIALKVAGGTQVDLATRFQRAGFPTVRQQTISKWIARGGIPAEWGEATELATSGAIKARDVFRSCQRKPARAA